jgi:hypothetical protein
MLFQLLPLDLTEFILGDEIMKNKRGPGRKISPFLWPPTPETNVTVPAIEKEVPGSGKSIDGSTEIKGHPLSGMKGVGKSQKEGLLSFAHSIPLDKKRTFLVAHGFWNL